MSEEIIISVADVLEGQDPKNKIVDMGFWHDIPSIQEKVFKVLKERGAVGVRYCKRLDLSEETMRK